MIATKIPKSQLCNKMRNQAIYRNSCSYIIWYIILTCLSTNGMERLAGTESLKRAASWAILSNTLRTISPRYIPEIVFSNICIIRTCQVCRNLKNNKYENNNLKPIRKVRYQRRYTFQPKRRSSLLYKFECYLLSRVYACSIHIFIKLG